MRVQKIAGGKRRQRNKNGSQRFHAESRGVRKPQHHGRDAFGRKTYSITPPPRREKTRKGEPVI